MSSTLTSSLLTPLSNFLPTISPTLRRLSIGKFEEEAADVLLAPGGSHKEGTKPEDGQVGKVELRIGGMTVSFVGSSFSLFWLLPCGRS